MGFVRYRAQNDQEADAEAAAGGQDGVAQTNARPHCQDRSVVESDAQRAPELLCRFRKQPEPVVVLQRGAMALAQVAQATQPTCIHELGEVYPSPTAFSRRSGYYIRCPVTVSTPEPEGGARCVS